ncbi:uncharacterized protein LOC115320940 [Ixodes scapularis]|uniref:uncharacterized protein LOC115320940 n=1 Tax=Ixodes scapularis TaxID=6945 RepID=UPI001A9CF844|nr:uncharacterized protein LOC115320940 [Ixodes scapularis]
MSLKNPLTLFVQTLAVYSAIHAPASARGTATSDSAAKLPVITLWDIPASSSDYRATIEHAPILHFGHARPETSTVTSWAQPPIKPQSRWFNDSGRGDSVRAMSLKNPLTLQVRNEYPSCSYRSDNVCLLELPCPRSLWRVLCVCHDLFSLLLMLSGDVETNPGPTLEDLMQHLTAIASDVKEIKEGKTATDALIAETNARLATIEHRVDGLSNMAVSVAAFETRIVSLEKNVNFLLGKVDDLENRSRRNNLLVYGIKETADESNEGLENCVKKEIFEDILGVHASGIEKIHRLGRKVANKTRPVILRFLEERDKSAVLSSCRRLKGSRFSISEDFSPRVQQIRKKLWDSAKELKKNGDKVVLSFDKIKINGQVFIWDDTANTRVPVYPATRQNSV